MKLEKRKTKFKYWIETIGILCSIIIILIWWGYFSFNDGVKWENRGQLGDSFGGLNTLFSGLAFSGIIFTILLQRRELSLQRNELEQTRKEFASNRLTNILYQQINIQQKVIADFSISFGLENQMKHSGYSAFIYLDNNINSFYYSIDDKRSEEELLSDKILLYRENLMIYLLYHDSFLDFAIRTSNSIRVIKEVLATSGLDGQEMKQFTSLFFDNIGFTIINVTKMFIESFNGYIQSPSDRLDNPPIDIKRMGLVKIHLTNLISLKEMDFNNTNNDEIISLLKK